MRTLVLCHEGAPMAVDLTALPLRRIIVDHPSDDVDLWTVWSVPPVGSVLPSHDSTKSFAEAWAMQCVFTAGNEPEEYLSQVPAFVLHHARAELIRIWQRRAAAADASFMPAVLKSAVAA